MTTHRARERATDPRERVYDAILVHCQVHGGQAPTLRELCDLTGLRSVATIKHHLASLALARRIELVPGPGTARPSRQARISGSMWLSPTDVVRVARLIQAADDARHALLEHGASAIDDVVDALSRALDGAPAETSATPAPRMRVPSLALAAQEGRAA